MLNGKPLDQRVIPDSPQPPTRASASQLRVGKISLAAPKRQLIAEVPGDQVAGVEIGDAPRQCGIEAIGDEAEAVGCEFAGPLGVGTPVDRVAVGVAHVEPQSIRRVTLRSVSCSAL